MQDAGIRRIYIVFSVIVMILAALLIRLFFIQIIGAYEYESASGRQHTGSLGGIGYRGTIYDRNGAALTNTQNKYIYLVEKTKLNEQCRSLLDAAGADRITVDSSRYAAYEAPSYREAAAELLKDTFGAFVFSTTAVYQEEQPSAHLIGYLNRVDNSGAFGLERAFDSVLYSDQQLELMVDAVGRLLPGYGVRRQGENPGGSVITTLDLEIQKEVETAFLKTAQKGSVCVLDVKSGAILAGASFPSFQPGQIGDYLESDEDELRNRLLQSSYPPGSVFKIIMAAAAIESGIVDLNTEFTCSGAEELYGVNIRCSKEGGHGTITLREAFAKSCNCAFIQLGKRMDDDMLLEMAGSFGVGKPVLDILSEETSGILPQRGDLAGAGIGNFSIGQGKLEMTCLQVAKMTAVIANKGKMPYVHLVERAEDENGAVYYEFEPEQTGKSAITIKKKKDGVLDSRNADPVISPLTAYKVGLLMKETVTSGTGARIAYDAAGKTGSAQSVQDGEKVVHGWFTGYFPSQNPDYVVTVFVEDGGGASPAVEIFNDIAGILNCPAKDIQ